MWPLHTFPDIGVELLISTAMNTVPKDGEKRKLPVCVCVRCVGHILFMVGQYCSVSSADYLPRLAEGSFLSHLYTACLERDYCATMILYAGMGFILPPAEVVIMLYLSNLNFCIKSKG